LTSEIGVFYRANLFAFDTDAACSLKTFAALDLTC
jgi:hypothetical protein